MLKMTIDNEEVVSKNNFTIKEEMLGASSTILNNVYPKSWELDHNYTSRFYYPKDYSKFLLNNYEYIPFIIGSYSTITGNGQITGADSNLKSELVNIDGDTTQDGTPTPTTPINIDVVTGLQEVEIVGKNWFDNTITPAPNQGSYLSATQTDINNGKRLTFTGSSSANYIFLPYVVMDLTNYVGKTIRFKCNFQASGSNIGQWYIGLCNADGSNRSSKAYGNGSGGISSFVVPTLSGSQTYLLLALYVNTTGTIANGDYIDYTNMTLTIDNEDMAYEPYKGNTYDINLGKNLFELNNGTNVNTTSSISNDALTLTSSGTWARYEKTISVIPNQTYTFSCSYQDNNGKTKVNFYDGSTDIGGPNSSTSSSGTFTNTITPTNNTIKIQLYSNFTSNNVATTITYTNVQLEKGSSATSYSNYFTPIELCKIGTYKDKIFKGSYANYIKGNEETILYDCELERVKNGYKMIPTSNIEPGIDLKIPVNTTIGEIYNVSFDMNIPEGQTGYLEVSGLLNGNVYTISNYTLSTTGHQNETITISTRNYDHIALNLYCNRDSSNIFYPTTITNITLFKGSTELDLDKWYLHKEIGKVVLNGSEDWQINTSGTTFFYLSFSGHIVNTSFSNYFEYKNIATTNDSVGIYFTTNYLRLRNGISTSKAELKTWLSTHNTIVYYVLANPTTTEITNTELVSQLNAIELIEGLNNISITGDLPGIMTIHYNYRNEDETTDLLFSGIVKNTSDISLNPREPKYCSLEILDYKTLLSEGDTLDFVISNKTILEAINMVVDSISSYGFELGNVNILNGNDIIGAYSTYNKTAYDVFQYLADISGAKWTCRQKDETSMYIDFYDPTLMPQGTPIEYTTEWAENNNLIDIKFNYGTRDYRNKQIIISDEVYGDIDYIENLTGNSVSTDFILSNNIAKITEIVVNGEQKTFATDVDKDIGIYADFYYRVGSNTIESNEPIESGNLITVTYTPIIKGREVIQNDDEITRLNNQLEVNGTIARYDVRNDETDSNKLMAIGETYLRYKGEAEITLTIKTFNKDLYNVGQSVYFNAPIQELAKNYMVKSKDINIIATGDDMYNVFYTYTLSSSFNAERQINWFDNQRNKTEGNIGEGEYISRNIDISMTANIIWSNVTATEVTGIVGNNELDATLDAPYNE